MNAGLFSPLYNGMVEMQRRETLELPCTCARSSCPTLLSSNNNDEGRGAGRVGWDGMGWTHSLRIMPERGWDTFSLENTMDCMPPFFQAEDIHPHLASSRKLDSKQFLISR